MVACYLFISFLIPKSSLLILLEPYNYLRQYPGKEIRTLLIDAFDHWLRVPQPELKVITKVIEMLHTASLLIDDVEDDSKLRRGVPVAHKIYGVPITINAANYAYFLALDEISKLQNPKMVQIFTEELLNLHRGQGMDLFWRDTVTCPTEEEYIQMVGNKTGGLLRLAVKLMEEASASCVEYVPLVNIIGIHFQIRDDLMNLKSDLYSDNKGYCEDLTEGKFSFPVIHCIRADTSNRQLLNILKQRTLDKDVKKFAVHLMEKTNSFEYTFERLQVYEKQARQEIARLGGNVKLEKILDRLSVDFK
ncbi:geranylgeranyl pyrophosphate synthase [Basidiobolus meristosporus CBS 931.73]|uniref:Geranylgeranyl pyrophosphate synthase n=1 Tax=Basidiobolus meristosporus CBS 931.73 TaxID=1314790 RepID=A0A1Y1YDX8_9FUNG|nr:geranylgeranyl pyrophosphate synthase [Basidiobolus meristosporus CBS 931.73]|eukprot:ORX96145.1 geranylgeranyl pyrophosphate synthase [Basidiobolus meristosporus CBS 931.73]